MELVHETIGPLGRFVAGAAFVIVLVVSHRALPEMGFTGASRMALAFCVAALSALGLMIVLRPEGAPLGVTQSAPRPDYFLLLPYAALGLTLLLLPFLFLIDWCFPTFKERFRRERKPFQSSEEWYSSQYPKPSAIKQDRDIKQTGCKDRPGIRRPTGDHSISAKRRFRQ